MKSLLAKKKFGQNFLHDQNIIKKIIQSLQVNQNDHLVEIGPGYGALTLPLLEIAGQLDVIEIDKDILPKLRTLCENKGELTIHSNDALKFDFGSLIQQGQKLRIVGNLPYNISTPLLFHLLKYKDNICDMHFMLQKEVVERITAEPCTHAYGRLSVMLQYYCEASYLFDVSPNCFHPKPKVDSAIIQLSPRSPNMINNGNPIIFEETVKAAFGQRRKTIRNTLKHIVSAADFDACNLDSKRRAETLSIEEFAALSRHLSDKNEGVNPQN